MRFLLGGGCTAGHLILGIAFYSELTARGHQVHYVLRVYDLPYNHPSLI